MKNQIFVTAVLISFMWVSVANAKSLSAREMARGYEQVRLGMSYKEVSELMGAPYYVHQPTSTGAAVGWCVGRTFGTQTYVMLFGPSYLFAMSEDRRARSCSKRYADWSSEWPKLSAKTDILSNHPDADTYSIDKLKITVIRDEATDCTSRGKLVSLLLQGEIGPDSSFAMKKLLERERSCDTDDTVNDFVVMLESGGGLLRDGYALGKILREYRASVVVLDDVECASSCAVAFLGGHRRYIAGSGKLLFHAPYYSGFNAKGEPAMACASDKAVLKELHSYYGTMIGAEEADVLIDRTMSYCSNTDGWVLTGNSAAELYGITQKPGSALD